MSDDFDNVMLDLARAVATKAKLEATNLVEATDALKALTGYYTVRLKHKEPDDTADKRSSFDDFKVTAQEDTSGAITGRRRPSSEPSGASESH